MPHHMITSTRPTPQGSVGCRTGFARTKEQTDAMVSRFSELGCRDVQSGEVEADELPADGRRRRCVRR